MSTAPPLPDNPACNAVRAQRPEIANRFARGYGDPGLQASAPGMATLPPPSADMAGQPAAGVAAAPPAPPVDPAVQEARDQARAARAAGPFFGGQPVQVADRDVAAPTAGLAAFPGRAAPTAERSAEVQPQNGQGAKRQFLAGSRSEDYLANPLLPPLSPWEVKAGTLISAALITAINSDLPGEVIAQVTRPVYDHVTGRTVLIPQGARLIGQYDSQVAYGQSRALIAWNRVIMPDGRSINIGSMTGADLSGADLSRAIYRFGIKIGARGLLKTCSRSDGYDFRLWHCEDGNPRVDAGCRWFTMPEAWLHWTKTRDATPLGEETFDILVMFEHHIERINAGNV